MLVAVLQLLRCFDCAHLSPTHLQQMLNRSRLGKSVEQRPESRPYDDLILLPELNDFQIELQPAGSNDGAPVGGSEASTLHTHRQLITRLGHPVLFILRQLQMHLICQGFGALHLHAQVSHRSIFELGRN